jgi:hypothetical protein
MLSLEGLRGFTASAGLPAALTRVTSGLLAELSGVLTVPDPVTARASTRSSGPLSKA